MWSCINTGRIQPYEDFKQCYLGNPMNKISGFGKEKIKT